MRCARCGKSFRPSGRGSKQIYCSKHCRQAAWRDRQKAAKAKAKVSQSKKASTKKPAVKKQKVDKVQAAVKDLKSLSKGQFDGMMTASPDEALQLVSGVLKKALLSDDTPANALTPISKEYIDVVKELDDRIKKDNGFAAASPTDAESELNASVDLGAI